MRVSRPQITRGVTFVIYLDEVRLLLLDQFDASPRRSFSTGVRVAVHGRGEAPDMKTALAIGPGSEANIVVSPMTRQRLGKPYHGCSEMKLPHGSSYSYTTSECMDLCLQDQAGPRNIGLCISKSSTTYCSSMFSLIRKDE